MESNNDDNEQKDTWILYFLPSLIAKVCIFRYNGEVDIFRDDHVGDEDVELPNGIQELVHALSL